MNKGREDFFLAPAYPGSPRKRVVKRLYACVLGPIVSERCERFETRYFGLIVLDE